MSKSRIDDLLSRLQELQTELEDEIDQLLDKKRKQFRYQFERGKIQFEQSIKEFQQKTKTDVVQYLRNARLGHILSSPIIYSVFFPLVALDIFASFYQHTCFRIYGIPRVSRRDYFAIDRQQLAYLNVIEKINCTYCGYSSGLIEYVREIIARTEQYWCPIKHAKRTPDPHRLVSNFVDYGDATSYKERLKTLQNEITKHDT